MNKFPPAKSKYRDEGWLTGIFFLCCLFPFVSPIPIETDTQPLFLVFAMIIVFLRALSPGLTVDKYILFGISISSLIYIDPTRAYEVDVGKAVSMVAGALTFIAIGQVKDHVAYNLIKKSAIIYFTYSCLIYLNSNFFLSLQEHFVRGVNVEDFSNLEYRGAPALATEPGLLGGLLVFLLIQLQYYGLKLNAPIKEMSVYGVVIILTILMTKSGTGYFYLLIFFVISYWRLIASKRFVYFIPVGVALIFLMLLVPGADNFDLNNRGFEVVVSLISGDGLDADTSVLKRIYDLRIGIQSLFDYPFGVGVNGVSAAVNELANVHKLIRQNDTVGDISLVSGVGYYFVSYGIFGLFFVVYLFFFLSRASILNKVLAFLFLAASYSPAFPAIWILLSQASQERNHSH